MFSNCIGDSFEHYFEPGEYFWVEGKQDSKYPIFNEERIGFSINAYKSVAADVRYFKKGVGMVESSGEGTLRLLNGAMIDGVVYGDTTIYTSIIENPKKPESFVLYQNYPNPFNPGTTIKFAIEANRKATLEIFNIKGQRVKTLFRDKRFTAAAAQQIYWNGTNDRGAAVATGLYLYRLISGEKSYTKRMILLK